MACDDKQNHPLPPAVGALHVQAHLNPEKAKEKEEADAKKQQALSFNFAKEVRRPHATPTQPETIIVLIPAASTCLLYTSDAADE